MVGADVVTIGTIIGALIGIITFLLRILVAAKTAHIESLEENNRQLVAERDLFRDMLLSYQRERGIRPTDPPDR